MAYQRSDEIASEKEGKRIEKFHEGIKSVGKMGLNLAMATRMAPFLSQYITPDIALKGISKINPKIGSFLKKGMETGLPIKEGLEFLKTKIDNTIDESEKKPAPKSLFDEFLGATEPSTLSEGQQAQLAFLRNITEQLEAKGIGKDNPALKRIRKKVKDVIEGKVSEVLGQAMSMQQPVAQGTPTPEAPPQAPMGQPPMQQPGQPAQPGQGQQALMAILQKIQAQRGA